MAGADGRGRVVVVGAGLAGLVAAERLQAAGRDVALLEAGPKAGGRCRSYEDARLGRVIDNGNHLILTANRAVLGWADRIGGAAALETGPASFPYIDLADGARFALRLGRGPFGALNAAARPPGARLGALLCDMGRLMAARGSVGAAVRDRGAAWRGFWDPMARAVLNEDPERADAGLLRAVLLRSFARGARASRPVTAPRGLGAALVEPALRHLAARGVAPRYRVAAQALRVEDGRLTAVETRDGPVALGPRDAAVLAVPVQALAALMPGLPLPGPGPAIANAHFLLPGAPLAPVTAVLGGAAQWVFRRGDVVSVTVSAAERSPIGGLDRDASLARLWSEMRAVVRIAGGTAPEAMPPARFLRERAATFDQTPAGVARRPPTRSPIRNVVLAGDHVATGLPATLEGAVLSGERAAAALLDPR